MMKKQSRPTNNEQLVKLSVLLLLLLGALSFPRAAQAGFIDHLAVTNDIGPNKVPHLGRSRILVIPVTFNARSRAAIDPARITRFFSDSDPSRFSFPGYWRVNSGGRFLLEADIAKPVVYSGCPFPGGGSDCTPQRGDLTALANGIPLIREIITRAHRESKLDFTRYDLNGPQGKPDGYHDGVVILINGGWFGVALPFGLLDARFEVKLDGVRVTMAAISSGQRVLPMAVHEFGHLLGLADLYDEWRRTYGLALSPMGGNWRYTEHSVPLLDAFSKMQLGWAEVEQVSGTCEALIAPAGSGAVYKLGAGREFFLLENRQADGPYDRHVGQPGLAVYHVNLDRMPAKGEHGFYRTVVDCPNCRRWRPFLMNVQADRRYDLQYRLRRFEAADLFRSGDALLPAPRQGRLTPSNVWFSSNDYWGYPTGVSVTDIDSDSVLPFIRATLIAPALSDPCKGLRCPKDRECRSGRCLLPLFSEHSSTLEKGAEPVAVAWAAPESETSWSDWLDWRLLSIAVFLVWMILRRRLKRRWEARLRKAGKLPEDENIKTRF